MKVKEVKKSKKKKVSTEKKHLKKSEVEEDVKEQTVAENDKEESTFTKTRTWVQPSISKPLQFSPWHPWEGIWTSSRERRPAVTVDEEVYCEPAAAAPVLPDESKPAVASSTPAAGEKGMCRPVTAHFGLQAPAGVATVWSQAVAKGSPPTPGGSVGRGVS